MEDNDFLNSLRAMVSGVRDFGDNVVSPVVTRKVMRASNPAYVFNPFAQIVQTGYDVAEALHGQGNARGKVVAQMDQSAFGKEKSEEALAEGQGDEAATASEGEREEEKTEAKAPEYDIDEMAGEFILGAWGNGQDRIDNMIQAGYSLDDYNAIQQRVNDAYASGRDLHEWTNKANAKLHYW